MVRRTGCTSRVRLSGYLGIAMAALHINATPFYVMIMAVMLGGAWNWWQAAGAALVGFGVIVAQGLPKKAN